MSSGKLVAVFAVTCTILAAIQVPLLATTKNAEGKVPFSYAAVIFLMELVKLLACLVLMHFTRKPGAAFFTLGPSKVILYAVPALIYCFTNNVVPYALLYMDPISFNLLSNLRILTAAIIFRALIRTTPFTNYQWAAFVLLVISGTASTYESMVATADANAVWQEGHKAFVTVPGLILMLVFCSMSGLSGVYSEKILKDHRDTDLFVQGMCYCLLLPLLCALPDRCRCVSVLLWRDHQRLSVSVGAAGDPAEP
jgi:probable UDP-sugar transporter A4